MGAEQEQSVGCPLCSCTHTDTWHPCRPLWSTRDAVQVLQQSCGVGKERRHSQCHSLHYWDLSQMINPSFSCLFFFFSKCLCPPIILCSGFQVQNKLPSQPSSYISSEHLTNCDEHNLPKITPVAGSALLGPSSSLWRTFPKLFGAYWLEGLQKKCLWISPDANLLFN